jgi:hypothetical protein
MAIQYEFAFSSEVVGAGIIAGGPYYCTFPRYSDNTISTEQGG